MATDTQVTKGGKKPAQGIVLQKSVRIVTDWTNARLRSAEMAAENGDITQAAQACEWILGDDTVSGALETRCEQLLGVVPTFEFPEPNGKPSSRVDDIRHALINEGDWWKSYPESEFIEFHRWGILLGLAPGIHRWREYNGRRLPCPEFWHPASTRVETEEGVQKWLALTADEEEIEIVPGDGTWILHAPYGHRRPWARGIWRSLSKWVLLKQYAMQDWMRHGEVAAKQVVTFKEDVDDEERRQLAQEIFSSAKDAVIALAAGADMKLVEATANTRDIYEAQINAANLAIQIRVRGGNLSSNVKDGSRAAAEVQERTGDNAKKNFDWQVLSTTFRDQSLFWYTQFNFDGGEYAPWPKWQQDRTKFSKERADTLIALGKCIALLRKAAKGTGMQLNRVQLLEEFNVPLMEGEDEELPDDEDTEDEDDTEDDESKDKDDDAP